ncbi:hypothetical protein AAVH_16505 [Aphelenchoides avenae]|nr:hypothetical protein AAVH_16505 [Aphelenchus avenae]
MVDALTAVLYVYAFIRELLEMIIGAFAHSGARRAASSPAVARTPKKKQPTLAAPAQSPSLNIRAPEKQDVYVKRKDPQYRTFAGLNDDVFERKPAARSQPGAEYENLADLNAKTAHEKTS